MIVPRCLREPKSVVSTKVVTFVDASKEAYGVVAYLRHSYEDGTVTSRMIASKSKVVPLTPITVLRLELMAAVFGVTHDPVVCESVGVTVKGSALLFR